jgi:glycosyltransferase involved in cell wall biosynthesis
LRILHVQKASGIGGSERHLLMLLPALARAGHDVRACLAVTADGERFAAALEHEGIETRRLPAGPDLNPLLAWRLRDLMRELRPDVVHTHLIHADVHALPAARSLGIPAVSSVHGTLARLRGGPMRAVAARAGRLPAVTIAISYNVRAFLEQNGLRPPGSVEVVHYGIEAGRWRVDGPARAEARAEYGLADDDVCLAMTARLIAGKGHDQAIAALARALPNAPRLRLLIAGDGPEREAVEARARDLPGGIVNVLGFVDDVRPAIAAADVLVFPTQPELGEGFGLAALEAMAAGRPVVATDVGALPEVVADGVTGVVVPPGEPAALAVAFERLAGDPSERLRLGAAGRERAESAFGVEAMVERTESVYELALGGATSSGFRSARSTSMPARFGARSRS